MREKSHSCFISKPCLKSLDEALGREEWLPVEDLDVLAPGAFCYSLRAQGETASMVLGLSWPWVIKTKRQSLSFKSSKMPFPSLHWGPHLWRTRHALEPGWKGQVRTCTEDRVYVQERWRAAGRSLRPACASDLGYTECWHLQGTYPFFKGSFIFYKIRRVLLQGFHYRKKKRCSKYLIISLPKIDSSEPLNISLNYCFT